MNDKSRKNRKNDKGRKQSARDGDAAAWSPRKVRDTLSPRKDMDISNTIAPRPIQKKKPQKPQEPDE